VPKFIRLAVTLGLLAAVIYYVGGVREIGRSLAGTQPAWIVLAFLVVTIDRLLMAYKWGLLLRPHKRSVPLLLNCQIYCSAAFMGTFLPATVGADAIRLILLRRIGLDPHIAVASIVAERMIGFIAALVTGIVGAALLHWAGYVPGRLTLFFAAGTLMLGGAALGFVLAMTDTGFRLAIGWLPARILDSRFGEICRRLHGAYSAYRGTPGVLLVFFLLTLLEQLVSITFTWVLARALGLDVSILLIAGIVPLAVLITRMPITIAGIGVVEGALVALLGLGGIQAADAVAVSVLIRLVQILGYVPWWLTLALRERTWLPGASAARAAKQPDACKEVSGSS
jgi:glycosyltransferase 2 family protein